MAECGLAPIFPQTLSSVLAPQAHARVFGRRGFRRSGRFFGRRPASVQRGISRTIVPGQASFRGSQVIVDRGGSGSRSRSNIKDIPGFSGLAQQGNAILEKDRVNPFIFRKLFIDPNSGALLGASRGETIRQLREFYLKNFDKFQGGAKALVQNFLVANGAAAALSGQLQVDVATGVSPKYKNMRDGDVRIAALNFLLNSISQTSRLVRVRGANGGIVSINMNGVMRKAALALLTNDNPYACGRNVPPRLDFLIERAMDPFTYNQLMEIKDIQGEAEKVGVQDDKKRSQGNKIVIAAPPGKPRESIVGIAEERTLEVQSQQRRPGLDWFISWDTIGNASPGVESESRNPFDAGINFTHDASEAIWHKSNGFLQFGLFNAAGAAQTQAPGNVALAAGFGKRHLGEAVQTPANCLICHSNGFRGGGFQGGADKKPYTDNTLGIDADGNNIGSRIPSFHKGFFTTNAAYFARAKRASDVFLNSMKRSGSFVPSDADASKAAELLPDFIDEYREPVSFEQAARELGTSKEAIGALFGRADGKITRKAFEKSFCSLQRRLGSGVAGGGVLSGGVRQGLPPAQQTRGLTGPAHQEGAAQQRRR